MIVLRDKPGSFVTVNKYHEKTHYEVLYLCVVFVDNKKNTEHQTVRVMLVTPRLAPLSCSNFSLNNSNGHVSRISAVDIHDSCDVLDDFLTFSLAPPSGGLILTFLSTFLLPR